MKLSQKLNLWGGKLDAEVSNNVLILTHKGLMSLSVTKYSLDDIDPDFDTYKSFSLGAAIASLLAFIMSVYLLWYGKTYYESPEDAEYLFGSLIAFVAFVIATFKSIKSRINVVTFISNEGGVLFNLHGGKPCSDVLNSFCIELSERIKKIRYGELSSQQLNEILSKHVHFLFEHDVLNELELKSAINKINGKTSVNVVSINQ